MRRHTLAAGVLYECVGVLVPTTGDDVDEVIGQHKGHSLSLDTKLALEVTQEMAKVNVDQLQGRVGGAITCHTHMNSVHVLLRCTLHMHTHQSTTHTCMHTYIHHSTYTHTSTHTHNTVHTHTHTAVHTHTHTHTPQYTHTHHSTHTHTHTHTHCSTCPFFFNMMLSECLSPIPNT